MSAMHTCTCFTERQRYKCSYYIGLSGVRLKANSHSASLPGSSELPQADYTFRLPSICPSRVAALQESPCRQVD